MSKIQTFIKKKLFRQSNFSKSIFICSWIFLFCCRLLLKWQSIAKQNSRGDLVNSKPRLGKHVSLAGGHTHQKDQSTHEGHQRNVASLMIGKDKVAGRRVWTVHGCALFLSIQNLADPMTQVLQRWLERMKSATEPVPLTCATRSNGMTSSQIMKVHESSGHKTEVLNFDGKSMTSRGVTSVSLRVDKRTPVVVDMLAMDGDLLGFDLLLGLDVLHLLGGVHINEHGEANFRNSFQCRHCWHSENWMTWLWKAYLQVHVLQSLWLFQIVMVKGQRYCLTRMGFGLNVDPSIMQAIVETVLSNDVTVQHYH